MVEEVEGRSDSSSRTKKSNPYFLPAELILILYSYMHASVERN